MMCGISFRMSVEIIVSTVILLFFNRQQSNILTSIKRLSDLLNSNYALGCRNVN